MASLQKNTPSTNGAFEAFINTYSTRHGNDMPSLLQGGKVWNRMSESQRNIYRHIVKPRNVDMDEDDGMCSAKKRKPLCRPRKPRCAPKSRCAPKPRCAPRRPACKPRRSCKPKCQNPGPVTNNGYLNFVRVYRRKHCGLNPNVLVKRAARAWIRLPECKKDRYRRQACKVTKNGRHMRRKVCAR